MIAFAFREEMRGTLQVAGERFDRPFRFALDVSGERFADFLHEAEAAASGTLRIDGIARDVPTSGVLRISPFRHRRICYRLDFTADDGRAMRFAGQKAIRLLRLCSTMTTLPGVVIDRVTGSAVGDASLRFDLRRDLYAFLRGFRLLRAREQAALSDG